MIEPTYRSRPSRSCADLHGADDRTIVSVVAVGRAVVAGARIEVVVLDGIVVAPEPD
jgi:hypothetical protein